MGAALLFTKVEKGILHPCPSTLLSRVGNAFLSAATSHLAGRFCFFVVSFGCLHPCFASACLIHYVDWWMDGFPLYKC